MQQRLLFLLFILLSTQLSWAQVDEELPDDEVIDNTVIKNDPQKRKEIKEKKDKVKIDNLFVGTTFSLSFGNFIFVDISPYAGYLLGKYVGIGVGATYIYSAYFNGRQYVGDHVYGGRIFTNLRPFPEIRGLRGVYAHVEGEYLNHTEYSKGQLVRRFVPAVNLGLGYNTSFDKGFSFTAEFLVNALWFGQYSSGRPTVYNSPWQYRIGIYYAF
ncbi:hypothetical protein [Aureispira anguillae]|uniref:Outer membrane protein beta-barrel domain-containing protein n=1 Tax=Aureispira anguillae TaxID=2864201 RepID=A0A915YGW4_9BACT|nr:hypothetical protein [Aureispira anguillae]BDS12950.1 hypothetical protein AsAng_0036750 [Aureispira anguillae]